MGTHPWPWYLTGNLAFSFYVIGIAISGIAKGCFFSHLLSALLHLAAVSHHVAYVYTFTMLPNVYKICIYTLVPMHSHIMVLQSDLILYSLHHLITSALDLLGEGGEGEGGGPGEPSVGSLDSWTRSQRF